MNPTGIPEQRSDRNQNLALGSGLAVGGNVLISVSLNLQKYVHLRNAPRPEPMHYTREPLWWLGLVLMAVGELFNFTAYGFAPASVVAPLGTTTVVANLFLAALFLKEKVKAENLFGCALAIIGAFLLVTFSKQTEMVMGNYELIDALSQPIFIAYVCVEILILAGLLVLLYHRDNHHVLIYLLISSITASFTVISAKAVSGLIQLSTVGYSVWDKPVLYALICILLITALIQIKYLNLAMKNYEATIVVPVNFVIFTISAILAGIVFYKEFYGLNGVQITMFLFGCVLSFVAVYFIAIGKSDEKKPVEPQHITSDLIPSWMVANVNVGQVQPSGSVSHLDNRRPILPDLSGPPAGLETIPEGSDLPDTPSSAGVGAVGGDDISVTSLDMLIDREKMGARDGGKVNYGATGGE